MQTWASSIAAAERKLSGRGIDEANINAEYLAMHTIGIWKKNELREYFNQPVSIEQQQRFESYIERRLLHEPLQYIVGETEFFGLRLFCSPAALIPRAETEIVVEEALREALRIIKSKAGIRILDIGTGSGAIILALASTVPNAECIGIDISPDALTLAEKNARRLGLKNVTFHRTDFMKTEFENEARFDLVVSNPPYIPVSELSELAPEVREFEPIQALTDNEGGFSFYEQIAHNARKLLNPSGVIAVETEYKGAQRVKEIFVSHDLIIDRTVKDLLGNDRVIIAYLNAQY